MSDFLNQIFNPVWIFSTLVVSFLVNLAAAYTVPTINKRWAVYSTTRKTKLEVKSKKFQELVEKWANSPEGSADIRMSIIVDYLFITSSFIVLSVSIIAFSFQQNSALFAFMVFMIYNLIRNTNSLSNNWKLYQAVRQNIATSFYKTKKGQPPLSD